MSSVTNTYDFGKGLPINISFQDDRAWQAIQGLQAALDRIERGQTNMTQQLSNLTQEVAQSKTVAQSAVALIQGLATKIEQMKDDPAALQALADDLKASDTGLAKAVTDNTPASPSGGTPPDTGGPGGTPAPTTTS